MKEMFLSWLAPQMENMIAYKQALRIQGTLIGRSGV